MQTIFKVGDTIRNKKSSKLGVVTRVYEEGVIKYHLIKTPNNIHTFSLSDDRFERVNERIEDDKNWR